MGWENLSWAIKRSLFIATRWVYLAMSHYNVTFYCHGLRNTCYWSLQGHFLIPRVEKNLSRVITQYIFKCHGLRKTGLGSLRKHFLLPHDEYRLPRAITGSLFIATGWVYLATGHYTITFYCMGWEKLATGHYQITFYWHGMSILAMSHYKVTFYCNGMSIPSHELLQGQC